MQGFIESFDDWDVYAINVQGNGGALRVDVTPPGVYRVGLFRTDGSEAVKPLGRAWLLANSAFWRVGRALLHPDQFREWRF